MLSSARLLFVSHDLSLSGAPLLLCEVAALLRRNRLAVTLAACEEQNRHPFLEESCRRHGIQQVPLPSLEDREQLVECYDAIVINTTVPHLWFKPFLAPDDEISRWLAARTIFWIHEIDEMYLLEEARRVVSRVGYVVFDSYVCHEVWRTSGTPQLPSKCRVIHPGVADDFLTAAIDARAREESVEPQVREEAPRARTRARLDIPTEAFVVLAVGVLPHKGTHAVVCAFGQWLERLTEDNATPPHLLIVGTEEGGETATIVEDLKNWATDRAALVHLVPATPETGDYFAAGDVLVVHSQSAGETFGRVTIEGMAYRLPVLGTDCGGTLEILLHRLTGWLHGTDDLSTLVDQMDYLRRHPDLAKAFGAAGLRRVRDAFDERRMERQWLDLLNEVVTSEVVAIGEWEDGKEVGQPSPFPHMEAQVCRSSDQLVLFGGFSKTYWDLNEGPIAVLDVPSRTWSEGPDLPPAEAGEIARSHGGMCTDSEGRIYVVSGQRGPRYAAALHECWCLDPTLGSWGRLPDLPVPRYCGALVEWRRQLHLFPGDLEDRRTPCREHWVLPLDRPGGPRGTGSAHGDWIRHDDRPVACDHFGAITLGNESDETTALYLIGGEHGHAGKAPATDDHAAPGAYIAHPYVHRYDFAADRWTRLADLPIPVHHIEHQVVSIAGRYLLVLSGAGHGSTITSALQLYDIQTDSWEVLPSELPQPVIGAVAWADRGFVYLLGGQTVLSSTDRRPGEVLADMIRAPVKVLKRRPATLPAPSHLIATTSA